MWLTYIDETEIHAVFEVTLRGGQYEYIPPVIIAGVLLKPIQAQVPLTLPGGVEIGSYTVPSPFLSLDYAAYDPITASIDDLLDLYEAEDWENLVELLVCRRLLAYYTLPEATAPPLPEYPYSWKDGLGYKHLFPSTFGTPGGEETEWVACNEYVEGMAVSLAFSDFLEAATNELPEGWHDGRYLCLEGGGIIPLYPQFCIFPQTFTGLFNFCISTQDTWDRGWNHGYGNIASERTQLMYPNSQSIEGFQLTNFRNAITAVPFYSPSAYADEYITIDYESWPSFSPDKPRIIPDPDYIPPGKGGNIGTIYAGLLLGILPGSGAGKRFKEGLKL